ncbi:MAG: hypothetical protein PHV82_18615, partial [Victivallaceae bacterium]|nr:hypothetical protein [Victivallaceae bacterium]
MIIQGKLTLAQQAAGRKYWHLFNIFNATTFACAADNVLYLFALEIGCPQYIIPVIASFVYIGFLAIPLGKLLVAKVGASYSVTIFWGLRSFFALISAASPFLISAFGTEAGIITLLGGGLGFYFCTSAGIVAVNPLLGEITLPEQRGKFTSDIFRNFNLVSLLWLLLISMVMKKYASRETFQIIISCGVLAGFASAFTASRITETALPRESAGVPLWNSLKEAARNRTGKKLLLANIAVMSGIVLVLPISVTAVKTGYQVSDSTALICALIQFGGGILIAAVSGVISTHSGPRPVVLLAFSLLIVSALMWICAPPEFSFGYTGFIFLLNGAAGMGAPMALTHYFLNIVPDKDRLGYSLFISMTAGICAGIFSFAVGAGLLKLIPALDYGGMEVFKIYFGAVIFLLFPFLLIIMSLERLRDWKVSQVLGLAFAPRDVRALLLLNKMEKTGSESQELDAIERLKHTRSLISADKILSYLESPKYLVKTKAMLALYEIPFGDNVQKRLLEELKYGTYTTAPAAAMILGARGINAAVPLLRRKLDSENIYLAGRSMVALTQLDDRDSFSRIKKIFVESDNQFISISGAVALSLMGDPESLKLLLEKTLEDNLDHSVRTEIYSAIAEIGGIGDEFYKLFKLYFTKKNLQNPLCIAFLEGIRKEIGRAH